jgi:non-heme chloroperoxidase
VIDISHIEVEGGIRLHVQDLGNGPAVLFISGFGLDGELWDRQVRVLADAGLRTVRITQRGHGRSDHPLMGYSIERLSADAAHVLGRLGVESVTVIGHSFGGQVAFHLAATRPDLASRLVLVASNAVRASWSERFPFGAQPEPMLSQLISGEEGGRIASRFPQIEGNFAAEPDPRTVQWLMNTWLQMPSWSAIACYRTMLTADLIDHIPRVAQPVLQIIGTADKVHSAKGARWLQSQLVDAELIEFDCGHFPMLETPDAMDAALLRFTAVG